MTEERKPSSHFKELDTAAEQVWTIARDFGLDPYVTHFNIVPAKTIHEVASYGLPGHYSHWSFGRAYRQLKTGYDYGLSKIYEVVVNSDPSQAYLMENNPPIQNKTVMAHVLGHTDFFKNNYQFKNTRKDMPHAATVTADRIRTYEFLHGRKPVEEFLEAALSVAEHIDPYTIYRKSPDEQVAKWHEEFEEKRKKPETPASDYDDIWSWGAAPEEKKKDEEKKERMPIPYHPDKDVLGFIRDFAPNLEDWQRDIIDIVRAESLYFYPQKRTKIMNEGWASIWHKRIMREMNERGYISDGEFVEFAKMHQGVVTPNPKHINPYHFGMNLYEAIADYYNGDLSDEEKRWLEREDIPVRPKYNGEFIGSPGHQQLFEVRELDDDQSFIRNYFDKIAADRMEMYIYETKPYPGGGEVQVIKTRGWEDIRKGLVSSMNNGGDPFIEVVDTDRKGTLELILKHQYEGMPLDENYVKRVMPYLGKLWGGRPVILETEEPDGSGTKKIAYQYEGTTFSKK